MSSWELFFFFFFLHLYIFRLVQPWPFSSLYFLSLVFPTLCDRFQYLLPIFLFLKGTRPSNVRCKKKNTVKLLKNGVRALTEASYLHLKMFLLLRIWGEEPGVFCLFSLQIFPLIAEAITNTNSMTRIVEIGELNVTRLNKLHHLEACFYFQNVGKLLMIWWLCITLQQSSYYVLHPCRAFRWLYTTR